MVWSRQGGRQARFRSCLTAFACDLLLQSTCLYIGMLHSGILKTSFAEVLIIRFIHHVDKLIEIFPQHIVIIYIDGENKIMSRIMTMT